MILLLVLLCQTVFLFPGQGSQYVGMSEITGQCDEVVRREVMKLYDRASAILNYDLYDVCLKGSEKEINSTVSVM